jgi:hypothetical protein
MVVERREHLGLNLILDAGGLGDGLDGLGWCEGGTEETDGEECQPDERGSHEDLRGAVMGQCVWISENSTGFPRVVRENGTPRVPVIAPEVKTRYRRRGGRAIAQGEDGAKCRLQNGTGSAGRPMMGYEGLEDWDDVKDAIEDGGAGDGGTSVRTGGCGEREGHGGTTCWRWHGGTMFRTRGI